MNTNQAVVHKSLAGGYVAVTNRLQSQVDCSDKTFSNGGTFCWSNNGILMPYRNPWALHSNTHFDDWIRIDSYYGLWFSDISHKKLSDLLLYSMRGADLGGVRAAVSAGQVRGQPWRLRLG